MKVSTGQKANSLPLAHSTHQPAHHGAAQDIYSKSFKRHVAVERYKLD
jgi:hypothetical protein